MAAIFERFLALAFLLVIPPAVYSTLGNYGITPWHVASSTTTSVETHQAPAHFDSDGDLDDNQKPDADQKSVHLDNLGPDFVGAIGLNEALVKPGSPEYNEVIKFDRSRNRAPSSRTIELHGVRYRVLFPKG